MALLRFRGSAIFWLMNYKEFSEEEDLLWKLPFYFVENYRKVQ